MKTYKVDIVLDSRGTKYHVDGVGIKTLHAVLDNWLDYDLISITITLETNDDRKPVVR